MKIEMTGSGGLPPELANMLKEKLGLGGGEEELKPARMDQIRYLLEKREPPKVGDIVSLRPELGDKYRYPKQGEKVIITQVMEQPIRDTDVTSSKAATRYDVAIAYVCEHGHVHEFLHDSRDLLKVGSIYDPIKLDNGETLAVE